MSDSDELYQKRDIMLARIDVNVTHMKEWTVQHKFEDDKRHDDNLIKFDKIDANDRWQNKILYGMVGVFVFIEFVVKLIK